MLLKVKIEGITPLLMHKFTDAAALDATDSTRLSFASGDRGSPREQARDVLYTDEDGKPIIPSPNILGALVDAGRFLKVGKRQLSTKKDSLVPACIALDAEYYLLKHSKPWEVDSRPVRIPATGGRILRYRPKFDDWSIEFGATLASDIITVSLARQLVDIAFDRIGLCDFRPQTRGPYGRAKVTKWQTIDPVKENTRNKTPVTV